MEDEILTVPYIVFESVMARNERTQKRLLIALVATVVLMLLSNLAWLYVWNSYEYVGETSEVTLDSGNGNANYIGNDGDITNGEDNGQEDYKIPQEKER